MEGEVFVFVMPKWLREDGGQVRSGQRKAQMLRYDDGPIATLVVC